MQLCCNIDEQQVVRCKYHRIKMDQLIVSIANVLLIELLVQMMNVDGIVYILLKKKYIEISNVNQSFQSKNSLVA